jgi:hypothetical protein
MDEYEVDLRDYLRVLWRGKWILLATFLAAVGVAALVSFRAPDVFRAEAVVQVERPLGLPGNYQPPSIEEVAERVRDHTLLLATLGDEETVFWLERRWTVRQEEDFLVLRIEASRPPAELAELLRRVVERLQEEYRRGVAEAITIRLEEITRRAWVLQNQLAAWQEKVDQAYQNAQAQREELLAAIEALKANPEVLALEVGEQSRRFEGALAERELELLYERLTPVELLLDGVDRQGIHYFSQFANRAIAAEAELISLAEETQELQELLSHPPSPIVILRGPQGVEAPVGPNRKMNLAVAGVLGLFCGVLLVFFWHSLRPDGIEKGKEGEGMP